MRPTVGSRVKIKPNTDPADYYGFANKTGTVNATGIEMGMTTVLVKFDDGFGYNRTDGAEEDGLWVWEDEVEMI